MSIPDPTLRVVAPAGYVTPHVLAMIAADGSAALIDADTPLPIRPHWPAAVVQPLVGTANASVDAGPFRPELGRAIWLTLYGEWSGSVALLRSTDNGVTRLPLTVAGQSWASFSANVNEAIGDESDASATYYLALRPISGSITYRVAQ